MSALLVADAQQPALVERAASVVGVYDTHVDAEAALRSLEGAGLDMTRLSIIGRDFQTEEHALGYYTLGDRVKLWSGRGAVLGGLWASCLASGVFLLPVVGPVVVLGPLVAVLIAVLEGAVLGGAAGALGAVFASIGLPEEAAVKYERAVLSGHFVLVAQGSPDILTHAQLILGTAGTTHLLEA